MGILGSRYYISDQKKAEYAVYGIAGVGVLTVLSYMPPFSMFREVLMGFVAVIIALLVYEWTVKV